MPFDYKLCQSDRESNPQLCPMAGNPGHYSGPEVSLWEVWAVENADLPRPPISPFLDNFRVADREPIAR